MSPSASGEDEVVEQTTTDEPSPIGLDAAEATVEVVPKAEPFMGFDPAPTPDEPSPAAGDDRFPLADPGEFYSGLWSGLPLFKCPYCLFTSLEGSGAIEIHILTKIEQGSQSHRAALEKR